MVRAVIIPIFYTIEAIFLVISIGIILFPIKRNKFPKLFIFLLIHGIMLLLFFIGIYEPFNEIILFGILGLAYILPITIILIIQRGKIEKEDLLKR